jgi:hypothetical protein
MLRDTASASNAQSTMMQEIGISAEQNDNDRSLCNSCSTIRQF